MCSMAGTWRKSNPLDHHFSVNFDWKCVDFPLFFPNGKWYLLFKRFWKNSDRKISLQWSVIIITSHILWLLLLATSNDTRVPPVGLVAPDLNHFKIKWRWFYCHRLDVAYSSYSRSFCTFSPSSPGAVLLAFNYTGKSPNNSTGDNQSWVAWVALGWSVSTIQSGCLNCINSGNLLHLMSSKKLQIKSFDFNFN